LRRGATIVAWLVLVPVVGKATVYVDAGNAAGPWDGDSWATAYTDLNAALDDAKAGQEPVWVAAGTYWPTDGDDRGASFRLKRHVAVYGGFSGGETEIEQRDPEANVTILSGDIGAPGDASDNVYHVIVGERDSALHGFTITGGNADGYGYDGLGGGVINYFGASPVIGDCRFIGNAAREGGGLYNYNFASPTVTDCVFEGNSAERGGAMVCRDSSDPAISGTRFADNTALWRGGAVHADYGASPSFAGCEFEDNRADGHGGAVYVDATSGRVEDTRPVMQDCVFRSNTAAFRGGGVAAYNWCTVSLTRCEFIENHAGTGGGAVAADYHATVHDADPVFTDNTADAGEADVDADETSTVD